MTRVLIIDDQRIAREYMESVVKNGEDYELAGSLSKADFASMVCCRNVVDLVLMESYTVIRANRRTVGLRLDKDGRWIWC